MLHFLYRINVKTFQQLQFLGEIVLVKHYWHTLTHISHCSPASWRPVNSGLATATSTHVPRWHTLVGMKAIAELGAEVRDVRGQWSGFDPRSRWQPPLSGGLSSSLIWPWSQSILLRSLPFEQTAPPERSRPSLPFTQASQRYKCLHSLIVPRVWHYLCLVCLIGQIKWIPS